MNHSDHVQAVAHHASAAASSPVAASWRRCMTVHGLSPEEARSPLRLDEQAFRAACEKSGALLEEARGEIDRLFATVGKAGCCLLLTDGNGVAIERRGAAGDDADFRGIGLWSGTLWSEASVGTNGIGTAIADERPIVIFRDQHFLSRNTGLSCATAPIRDHCGRVTGAIDISTCRQDAGEMAMTILSQAVRDVAARIESNLFHRAFRGHRVLLVPAEGKTSPALLAIDRDDLVLGATRAARLTLGIDDLRIAAGIPAADLLHDRPQGDHENLDDAERAALRRVLSRANGNVSAAAESLGISRATLYRKIKKLLIN